MQRYLPITSARFLSNCVIWGASYRPVAAIHPQWPKRPLSGNGLYNA